MKPPCEEICNRLADEGPQALRDDRAAQDHVSDCAECFALLEALSAIESGLARMPEHDVSDSVVEALLARPELAARPAAAGTEPATDRAAERIRDLLARAFRPRSLVWAGGAAAVLVLVVTFGLQGRKQPFLLEEPAVAKNEVALSEEPESEARRQRIEKKKTRTEANATPREVQDKDDAGVDRFGMSDRSDDLRDEIDRVAGRESATRPADVPAPQRFYEQLRSNVLDSRDAKIDPDAEPLPPAAPNVNSIEELEGLPREKPAEYGRVSGERSGADQVGGKTSGAGGALPPQPIEAHRIAPRFPATARSAAVRATVKLEAHVLADGSVGEVHVLDCDRPGLGFEEAAVEAVEQWRYTPATRGGRPVEARVEVTVEFDPAEQGLRRPAAPTGPARAAARGFLAERERLAGLRFRDTSGYWANTYVPGDPTLRLLQARLAGVGVRTHDLARPAAQPFDAPAGSALDVFLHSDRPGLAQRGRVLVQVGLQATPRHGGRRPAMNLGVVLDLRDAVTTDTAIAVRALLEALNRAQEPGDRFRVIVAGRPGGCVIQPRSFRHGFVQVTLDRLFDGRADADGPTLDLVEAMAEAIRATAAADDPTTPLGSSAVLLISARDLAPQRTQLADLAHQSAVAGVPVSVVGIGADVDLPALDALALAGQGTRRLLDAPAAAAALVDRELAAASRTVARAVRLRIRLAPGVELIDVVGSQRLDARRAERVRRAEKSIDLRLARDLGIHADRGEDEEGIQIVIPAFYAGDAHVVLLDVVAPGPGPIADVTVRYKDLVQLRNGVARAGLALADRPHAPGPLERNVLKNLLSRRLAAALDQAGRAVAAQDPQRARALLAGCRDLLIGLQLELPGLAGDPDVDADVAMLREYDDLLAAASHGAPDWLSESLRYAALLEVLPRHLETRS